MSVPCAHCGEDIDILIAPGTENSLHYHGRCYSAVMRQQEDQPEPSPGTTPRPPQQQSLEHKPPCQQSQ